MLMLDCDVGLVIIFNFMLLMCEMGFQVIFVVEDNYLYLFGYIDELQVYGVEVLYEFYCLLVEVYVKQCGYCYDLVLLICLGVIEKYLEIVCCYCLYVKLIYYIVDLYYLCMQCEVVVVGIDNMCDVEQMKFIEYDVICCVDVSIVVSMVEQVLFNQELL